MKTILLLLALSAALPAAGAVTASDERTLEARQITDRTRIEAWRGFQSALISELERLALRSASAPLSAAEAARLRDLWSGVVDLQLSLDVVEQRWRTASTMRGPYTAQASATAFDAWLARTSASIAAIEATRPYPDIIAMLNEPLPQLGVAAGSWTRMMHINESAATANQLIALESATAAAVDAGEIGASPLREELAARIRQWLRTRNAESAAENASRLLQGGVAGRSGIIGSGHSAWLGQAQRMMRERPLVNPVWTARLEQALQPGDIILTRHEWEPGEAGHSSFWSGAAVWIGSAAERRHYFRDPHTVEFFRSQGAEDLDSLIRSRAPSAYGNALSRVEVPARAVATTPFGITFAGSEILAADSVAVLRMRRSPADRAMNVVRAFELTGHPFDAMGDLSEGNAISPAELVLRSMGDDAPRLGLQRASVDDLVEWYSRFAGSENPTWELVMFLDGDEVTRNVAPGTVDAFRESPRRPVWRTWLAAQPAPAFR